jgi:hypothetical protein
MIDFPAPAWVPTVVPTLEWTLEHLRAYLNGKDFTVFTNGTCVVWPDAVNPSHAACEERLLSVVRHHPDFKVRRHSSGDALVTFRGGVGGVMSGEILKKNLVMLQAEAYSQGRFPTEMLFEEGRAGADNTDLIAGLYVRARLYLDAKRPVVVYTTRASI